MLGAYDGLKLVGYCVFEPISGDITQIAVDQDYRRQGIATVLLSEILKSSISSGRVSRLYLELLSRVSMNIVYYSMVRGRSQVICN